MACRLFIEFDNPYVDARTSDYLDFLSAAELLTLTSFEVD